MQLLNPGHTATAFDSDLQSFFRPFAEMGGLVERWIEETVGALINRDQERAHKVVTADMVIDAMQRAWRAHANSRLAAQQPGSCANRRCVMLKG